MRNKIIALALTVVMAVLALASCASSYNYAEEDLSKYATLDADAFKKALKEITIEDASFTTDKTTREKKVIENILSTLATYAEKNGEQKKDGALGANDVLYYAYYTTYEIDGKTYAFNMSEMKTTDFTSSTTTVKDKHHISLSSVDVEDKNANKLSVALKNAIAALSDKTIAPYATVTTAGASIKDKDNKANYDTIYVSYNREHNENESTKVTEEAKYEKIDLTNTADPIVAKLLDANTTAKINSVIEIKNGDVTEKTFKATIDGIEYKYTNFKVLFAVEKEGKELVSFKYAPYTTEQKLEPDSLYTDGVKVTIPKDAELTYHVYPVYYYQVSDISATSIIIEVFADKIATDSLDILASEEYKNGDKTVKALVEELVKIQGDKSEDKNLKDLKKAYDDAAKVVKDAGSKATAEQKEAEEKAEKAYNDAKKKAVSDKTAEILKATKAEADPIADVIVKEYKEDIYHTLKEEYDAAIIENIGKAIWKLVSDSVKVNSYPEELIKESVAHLENEYEYKFYNENTNNNSSTAESNYKYYKGDFDAYMVAVTKAKDIDDVPAKLEAEAKEFVKPIIQLFVASKAIATDAEAVFKKQLEENSFVYTEDDEEGKEFAYYCAENFVIDDDVLKKFKDIYGDMVYENYINGYGEENLRASLQANNFFDYLLSAKLAEKKEGDDSHAEYDYAEGEKLKFYNIEYTIKEAEDDKDSDKTDK